jgi:uncharacterized lipoprotein YmbA
MMGHVRPLKIISLCLFAVVLSRCVDLGKVTTKPTRFYVLEPISSSAEEKQLGTAEHTLVVGVGPVILPSYLNRPQIVTRSGHNELQLAEFHRWAEPLERNFTRVLAENLSIILPTDRVASFPWKGFRAVDYQTKVEVTRFEGRLDSDVELVARWFVLEGDKRKVVVTKTSSFSEPTGGGDYAALVSSQSRLLEALSQEIAATIKEMLAQKLNQ